MEAVGAVMAAIEIVDDRYVDWRALDAPTLTADDFFGAGCVLGRDDVAWRDLDLGLVSAMMAVNGREIGSGVGADILGDPLEALVWLANGPARATGLPAGSIVMLGQPRADALGRARRCRHDRQRRVRIRVRVVQLTRAAGATSAA